MKVSGGEKQRLSIARALLRHPHLLVFDEATSSLDSLTEEEISETIRDVAAGQDVITILIAHRLSTIMHADRIFVLERGQRRRVGLARSRCSTRRGCTTRCGGSRLASADRRRSHLRPFSRRLRARPGDGRDTTRLRALRHHHRHVRRGVERSGPRRHAASGIERSRYTRAGHQAVSDGNRADAARCCAACDRAHRRPAARRSRRPLRPARGHGRCARVRPSRLRCRADHSSWLDRVRTAPSLPRWALRALPAAWAAPSAEIRWPSSYPCHRVVAADGKPGGLLRGRGRGDEAAAAVDRTRGSGDRAPAV